MHRERTPTADVVRWIGLVAGPALAVAVYAALPAQYAGVDGAAVTFGHAGRATAAIAVWMATWWLTAAIDIAATALLPIALFPLLGARGVEATTQAYGSHLIFLYLGGFLIALAMERWGLHRRFALRILSIVGTRPSGMVAGFMFVTATLSMWVSNTATTLLMLPLALSVVDLVGARPDPAGAETEPADRNFGACLMLGIAYSASIGGIATAIGTPTNLVVIDFARKQLGVEISFARWLLIGLPLVVVYLPLSWWLMTRWILPVRTRPIEGSDALLRRELEALGPMSRGECITLCVFLGAAASWIAGPWLRDWEWGDGGRRPLAGLGDTTIAIVAGLILFVAPVNIRERKFVLDWSVTTRLPWGTLILFGGGLTLAEAIRENGVGELIGSGVGILSGAPGWVLILAVITIVIFLTELTSNVATTATLVPILASLAPRLGIEPVVVCVAATVAASCAFMLPVATPPNAVVFGSGHVTSGQMARAGLWLNIAGIGLIQALAYLVIAPLLGKG